MDAPWDDSQVMSPLTMRRKVSEEERGNCVGNFESADATWLCPIAFIAVAAAAMAT